MKLIRQASEKQLHLSHVIDRGDRRGIAGR